MLIAGFGFGDCSLLYEEEEGEVKEEKVVLVDVMVVLVVLQLVTLFAMGECNAAIA